MSTPINDNLLTLLAILIKRAGGTIVITDYEIISLRRAHVRAITNPVNNAITLQLDEAPDIIDADLIESEQDAWHDPKPRQLHLTGRS